jgi:hypothetical protein
MKEFLISEYSLTETITTLLNNELDIETTYLLLNSKLEIIDNLENPLYEHQCIIDLLESISKKDELIKMIEKIGEFSFFKKLLEKNEIKVNYKLKVLYTLINVLQSE